MLIKDCRGYELEKEKSNTSEDFFNRSEVTYIENGQEKTLHVLYVRFFDESVLSFTPYSENPLFTSGGSEFYLKDIAGIVCLLANPGFRSRKRVYINSVKEFSSYFEKINYQKLEELIEGIINKNGYEVVSPLDFTLQEQR
ncbi:hypothetical protein D0469_13780 [Peribacillus saganii]|uniref:Uncharacterized protein n=1 Tax=Peribacillus saganii TaxID=2303992 RepID=A0A372LLL7_9BACI|nr:hypothetical protein [Peribacillus saganii]RFU67793.1 hypothetical protein D0469_13780 [Peribacillus saganii]